MHHSICLRNTGNLDSILSQMFLVATYIPATKATKNICYLEMAAGFPLLPIHGKGTMSQQTAQNHGNAQIVE